MGGGRTQMASQLERDGRRLSLLASNISVRLGFSAQLIQPALGKFVVQKLLRSRITLSAQLNLNNPPTSIFSRSRQLVGRSPHASIAFLAHGCLRRLCVSTSPQPLSR